MYYETARGTRVVLTGNDLKHTVLLHVGRKVPGSHVLLHYANIGQLLLGENKSARTQSKSLFSSVQGSAMLKKKKRFLKVMMLGKAHFLFFQ